MNNSVRSRVTHAITYGSLTGTDLNETDADCIGALARSDPLGATLWRLASNFNTCSFLRAIDLLVQEMEFDYIEVPRALMNRVCRLAVLEWLAGSCRVCNGNEYIVDADGENLECPACNGSGRMRGSDAERIEIIGTGRDIYLTMIPTINEAAKILDLAENVVSGQISIQLERKPAKSLKSK